MKIEIEISDKEYSILTNAMDIYEDYFLDQAEFYKDRKEQKESFEQKAKEVNELREKLCNKVTTIAEEEHKAKLELQKNALVEVMIEWAKSESDEPTFVLEDQINAYFAALHAKKSEDKDIIYADLVISCIYTCSKSELKKLDRIKNIIIE